MTGGLRKRYRHLLAGAGIIGVLAVSAHEARAQDLSSMQSQIDALQATVRQLQKQVQDAQAQAAAGQSRLRLRGYVSRLQRADVALVAQHPVAAIST